MPESIYTDGSYLEKTGGTWHLEDSPAKARAVLNMLGRHPNLGVRTVCEIGSGAGGILAELQKVMPKESSFTGYEISTQAHQLSQQFANDRCRFVVGDAFADGATYDLALIMDVIEHVEDCFAFMREAKKKARYKLYNIPLDTSASFVLRGYNQWETVGHLHLFTTETALLAVKRAGQRVVDWSFMGGAFERHDKMLKTHLMNMARASTAVLSEKLAVRLFGGYSIVVLAE